jgi:hypothetical protein
MWTQLLAQVTGGRTILEDNISQIQKVQSAWDTRWLDIFSGSNGLYDGINKFAAIIVVGAFIAFAVTWVKEAIERGIFPALPHVLWVILVFVLLYDNGRMLGSLTLGLRNLINDQTRIVLEVQIGQASMLDALNDVIVSQQAKTVIQQQYAACEAKIGQAQIDCFQEAGNRAKAIIDRQYRAKGWFTAGVQRLWAHIDVIGQRLQQEAKDHPSKDAATLTGDLLTESLMATAGQAIAQQLLKSFQWAFTNMLELAMLLTGLIGPLAVAGSILPLGSRPIWAWLIGFSSLGLAKFSYNVIVGLAATVVVAADAQSSADIGFLLLISILAPILALAIAGGGGMAVFRGMSGGITRMISVGTTTLPLK